MPFFTRRAARAPIAAVAALALVVAGCAINTAQRTEVKYYPQCYKPVGELRADDAKFLDDMFRNTLLGALGGAAAGALIGRDAKGAAWGALGGALVGAGGTYVAHKINEQPNDAARRQSIAGDMNRDSAEIQRTVAAARTAESCYAKEFDALVAGVRAKRIAQDEAKARFREIDQGTTEMAEILKEYNKKAQRSSQEYRVAFETETARPTGSSQGSTSKPATPAQRQTLQKNYTAVSQSAEELSATEQSIERDNALRRASIRGLGIDG